jgi:mono/diheme cytochrome c family protein
MMKITRILFLFGFLQGLPGIDPRAAALQAEEPLNTLPPAVSGSLMVSRDLASNASSSPTAANSTRRFAGELGPLLAVKSGPVQTRQAGAGSSEAGPPTFLRDVLPIFIGKCFRCHNDQTRFLNNWSDYHAALADRWEIRRRIWDSWKGDYFKQPMPTGNSPESDAITKEERAVIKDWVDTGAVRGVQPSLGDLRSKAGRLAAGKALFTTICAACHQPTGQGIPSRFPPLARSDFLNSNKERAIGVLLHGLQGELVVNGMKFNNSMPLLPLSDEQIAAALTFVYNSFGNSGKDVTPEEVKTVRGRNDWLSSAPEQARGAGSPQEKSPWE